MKRYVLTMILAITLVIFIIIPAKANDITGQTWVLDTAGSITTRWTDIVWIIWTNITGDGDDLVIHEKSGGDVILKLKGLQGVDMIVPFPGNSGHIPGIYLTTISSGEVLVRTGKN